MGCAASTESYPNHHHPSQQQPAMNHTTKNMTTNTPASSTATAKAATTTTTTSPTTTGTSSRVSTQMCWDDFRCLDFGSLFFDFVGNILLFSSTNQRNFIFLRCIWII